jgi:hypothetical protein
VVSVRTSAKAFRERRSRENRIRGRIFGLRNVKKKFMEENIMKRRENKYYLMACSILVLLCFACVALAADTKKIEPTELILKKKADLIVETITIKKVAQDPAIVRPGTPTKVKYKVEIKVTVKNKAVGLTAASTADSLSAEGRRLATRGAFKVLLEWSDNPPAGFNYLSEGGVTVLAPGASTTLTFEQWVPKGTARKYRATADHLGWIAEWDETNNVNSAGYIAE